MADVSDLTYSEKRIPKGLQTLEISLLTHDQKVLDITSNVPQFSLYEDIDSFFVHGEMSIVDNSGMLVNFPLIGQEFINIRMRRFGEDAQEIIRTFFVSGVSSVKRLNETSASIFVHLVSPYQLTDSQKVFSRSYQGLNTDIISKIFLENFSEYGDGALIDEITMSEGGSSVNIVFPYMKPFQAIQLVLDTTVAGDGSPLYLFETLYEEGVQSRFQLMSWKEMMEADIDTTIGDNGNITPRPSSNTSEDIGVASTNSTIWEKRLDSLSFKKGYDVYGQIIQGNLKHQIVYFDISKKTYKEQAYDYRVHAPTSCGDFVAPELYDNTTKNTRVRAQKTNDMAYKDLPLLNSIDPMQMSASGVYKRRRNLMVMEGSGPGMENLKVGKCVEVDYPIYRPKFTAVDDERDKYNSGKFLVSAVRHNYNMTQYTVDVELIRDGINPDEEID